MNEGVEVVIRLDDRLGVTLGVDDALAEELELALREAVRL